MKRLFWVNKMKMNFAFILLTLSIVFTNSAKSAEIHNPDFNYFSYVRFNVERVQLSYEKLDELVLKSSLNYLVALDALEVVWTNCYYIVVELF